MSDIINFKLVILRNSSSLRDNYIAIRAKTQRSSFVATVIQVMNTEMVLSDEWSKRDIFQIKHTCVSLARQFCTEKK